jgi:hypothetical protein
MEGHIKRAKEEGKEPAQEYLDWWDQIKIDDANKVHDPKWQKDNLEYDLRSTEWIVAKTKSSEAYSQNIYAALCNNEFTKLEVIPILKEQTWSCSWRHAGGIVADMREEGDYIDWYCSGIGDGLGNGDQDGSKGYVPESTVTEEIEQDLKKLGWVVVTNNKDD